MQGRQTAAEHLEPGLATYSPPDADGSRVADQGPGQTQSALQTAQQGGVGSRLPSDSHPAGFRGVSEAHSGEEAQQSAGAGRRAKRKSQVVAGHRYQRKCRAARRRRHSGPDSDAGERVELLSRRGAKPFESVCRPEWQRVLPARLTDYDLSCDSEEPTPCEKRCRLTCLDSEYRDSVEMQQPLCKQARSEHMVAHNVAQVRSNWVCCLLQVLSASAARWRMMSLVWILLG